PTWEGHAEQCLALGLTMPAAQLPWLLFASSMRQIYLRGFLQLDRFQPNKAVQSAKPNKAVKSAKQDDLTAGAIYKSMPQDLQAVVLEALAVLPREIEQPEGSLSLQTPEEFSHRGGYGYVDPRS